MATPNRSRRAVRAAILAAVIFLAGDVLVGFGTAEEAIEPQVTPPPAEFGTPAPAVGDRIVYEQVQGRTAPNGGWTEEPRRQEWRDIEWVDQAETYLTNGTPARFHAARLGPDDRLDEVVLFDAHSQRQIGKNVSHNSSEEGQSNAFPIGDLQETESKNWQWNATLFEPTERQAYLSPLPCGMRHALQGEVRRTDGPIQLLANDCELAMAVWIGASDWPPFSAVRAESAGGIETIVFAAAHVPAPDSLPVAVVNVTIWLREDLPYPVRVDTTWDDGGPGLFTLGLTAIQWAPGTEPLRYDPPNLDTAPPLAFAPVKPWGIDDEGIDHPFPLSEAYRRAEQAAGYEELRTFLEDHPDGFAASAAYVEFTRDEQITRRWTISVADSDDHVEFCAFQHVRREIGTLIPGSLGLDLPEAPITYEFEPCDWVGAPIDVDRRPTHLPTAASLLARAQAYLALVNESRAPNSYGFILSPDPSAELSIDAGLVLHLSTSFPEGQVPYRSDEQAWQKAEIEIRPTGETTSLTRSVQESARGIDPDSAAEGMESAAPPATPLSGDVSIVTTWGLPPTPVVMGVGLMALLIGALYYMVPNLKAGVVGLFTRVRPAKALDQSTRAAIEQALRAEPGLHPVELARLLGTSRGAVDHHLAQLAQAGLVTSVSSGRYRCYFLAGSVDRRVMDATPVLKAEGARALLAAIGSAPGRSLSELAAATGLSSSTVNHHAERLAQVGLVERRRDGRIVAHFATDLGKELA